MGMSFYCADCDGYHGANECGVIDLRTTIATLRASLAESAETIEAYDGENVELRASLETAKDELEIRRTSQLGVTLENAITRAETAERERDALEAAIEEAWQAFHDQLIYSAAARGARIIEILRQARAAIDVAMKGGEDGAQQTRAELGRNERWHDFTR
jgi:hypothetical protein